MPKSRVVLEHPLPFWSQIWLTKLIVALWACILPTTLEAQSRLGANRVAQPEKPAGFPAIDTLKTPEDPVPTTDWGKAVR